MIYKWLIAKWRSGNIFISPDGIYFLEDGRILRKEYHYGICYRAKGSSRRYYYNKLNKDKEIVNKALRIKVNG